MLLKILSLLTCLLCLQEVSATYGYRTKCHKPNSPLNGNVTMTRSHFGYQKLIYSCNTGYKLVGRQTRTCYNGAWAGYQPICQPINDSYKRVHYSCSPGFVLIGKSNVENETLEGIKPDECYTNHLTCKPVKCMSLTAPTNGSVQFNFGTNLKSRATFSCNANLTLIGSSVRECQPDGNWSGKQPVCREANDCPKLQPPHYGKIYVTGYFHGDYAMTKCYYGYRLIGKARLDCLHTGKWTGVIGRCVKQRSYWRPFYY
ncbi:PREDICTED: sushi, von Willebrand factor type A, EGF and pentraxin domain-containing protein 1-like isoform X2 [Amphimedon queenslandica]|uniref:Sushi domain-containing protein n=1 Tax=Amphimedon queenslandica TaxID=400682 RepID=A0AAN0K2V9_AMPQE|nr:PREDICTED: sushi, von Willebrand factor type A, EGF and pentraxin domain-containing protein 1-like isoform X2 [Amphimedon queenslandica]|eukprot:XP_019863680.1 PREDICTED: sushi, von Willebrand factor type A, EGF and pentraxin domain-containing protein 1-like isoform X2 [Amphimedon queenslandica]